MWMLSTLEQWFHYLQEAWGTFPVWGFVVEVIVATLLSFYAVSPTFRKNLANFVNTPAVLKGFFGYGLLMGVMFLASVVRTLYGYRHLENVAAQVNQLMYQKNALIYGTSLVFLIVIYQLAKLTVRATAEKAPWNQSAYETLAEENRNLRQKLNYYERSFGTDAKKAI